MKREMAASPVPERARLSKLSRGTRRSLTRADHTLRQQVGWAEDGFRPLAHRFRCAPAKSEMVGLRPEAGFGPPSRLFVQPSEFWLRPAAPGTIAE
jgi:hypothetical protein